MDTNITLLDVRTHYNGRDPEFCLPTDSICQSIVDRGIHFDELGSFTHSDREADQYYFTSIPPS